MVQKTMKIANVSSFLKQYIFMVVILHHKVSERQSYIFLVSKREVEYNFEIEKYDNCVTWKGE